MTVDNKSKKDKNVKNTISIKGAKSNNLKNIDLDIPKNQLIVFTGVSGSGKSSLTMDTLYAEGQRRYVESLSSYARQFLMRMKKPEVDSIKGICPAIAIEQKVSTRNARSTVGTLTEVYDFLRLLFAKIGKTYSPVSGKVVKRHHVSDVMDFILEQEEKARIQVFIPVIKKYGDRNLRKQLEILLQKGFSRILVQDQLLWIEESLENEDQLPLDTPLDQLTQDVYILIDRFAVKKGDEENTKRMADSIQTAFQESEGECMIEVIDGEKKHFNNRFELDGILFQDPTPQLFNFNNPYGACPTCEGFSQVMGLDIKKIVPQTKLSVYEDAIACWRGEKYSSWKKLLLEKAHLFNFPVHTPYEELSKAEKKLLWDGNEHFYGIGSFFDDLQSKMYKIQNRVMLARYRGRTICPTCEGSRLKKEALYVKIEGHSIHDLVQMPIDELHAFFSGLSISDHDNAIAKRLLLEIKNRLEFMLLVGLPYLRLDRISSTLSGGETQRLNLTRTLGSNLTSSLYILDEPSIGLHPKDTSRLIKVLKSLRDLGNTVIVVEHEEDIIRSSDYLVDIGPEAGIHGGHVVYSGPTNSILRSSNPSLTLQYLRGDRQIPLPVSRREIHKEIRIIGAQQHNLKNIDVRIPLQCFTAVSGVSGSGKTTLIKQILYPALMQKMGEPYAKAIGSHKAIEGDWKSIDRIEMINQNPIGKSSRSNPVTYVKAYDAIRRLMADQQLSKIKGFKPKHFSFNVEGGRCETCKGEGEQLIEMQFLADIRLECEACKGKRFKKEVLEVQYRGKNIHDILSLSIEEALEFFKDEKEIYTKLKPLNDVGLGYVCLGQSSNTLSGGEAQRVKLASFLAKERSTEKILFIFDEPTTGLHFHDIQKLLHALNALVDKGHSLIVIEHNMDILKSADWIIDLGPEGGKKGGQLLFEGRPEDLVDCEKSATGSYLKEHLTSLSSTKS